MTNAIFTASETSKYDDLIEVRYHFPRRYLRRVEAAVDDLIAYYKPRRSTGPNKLTYFAVARVTGITEDPTQSDHYYAHIAEFLDFDHAVSFREGSRYRESSLQKSDGSTNKGSSGQSVRLVPEEEFDKIFHAGFLTKPEEWELADRVAEPVPEYVIHPTVEQVSLRKFRDVAFRRHVRNAYANTCAVTGLRLINGGGRPEVQAAHIRPVQADGPDTVRNGIALTGTAHWLFDRGLLSFDDDYNILLSPHGLPDGLDKLILPDRKLRVPSNPDLRPHRTYLAWHRDHCFKR
ncbi:MAG: HNH endonuclease [Rhodanobacter sp.]